MHKLLERQLKRFAEPLNKSTQNVRLNQAISDAYEQHESELKLLERSLFLTSTELNEQNRALQSNHSLLKASFDAIGDRIIVFDLDGRLVNANSRAREALMGINFKIGDHWKDLYSQLGDDLSISHLIDTIKTDPFSEVRHVIAIKDGRFIECRTQPQVLNNELVGRVWCYRDVTQQKLNEETIEHQAYHDGLTGLPNRACLIDTLHNALHTANIEQQALAVLFIDLDDFKKVNDSEGHATGDDVLIQVASRFQQCLGNNDILCRLGGDEFVVVIEHGANTTAIADTCKALLSALTSPFETQTNSYYVSASIGVSIAPLHDVSADALLRKADMAMYKAKFLGKNSFQIYSEDIERASKRQLGLEQDLRMAIEREELTVYLQPEVDVNSMRIVGAEALVRWIKPNGNVISPAEFIPLAEQTRLISGVGLRVLQAVGRYQLAWRQRGLKLPKIAVNMSILEFRDADLITTLLGMVKSGELVPDNLVIELTESIFMEDKDAVLATMLELKTCGIEFALDDFGTGYSSLSYLQSLPIDYLKIDRSFLSDVINNPQTSAITQSIMDIGRNLGLKMVAEGIEDKATLDYVRAHHCSLAQGFHLFRPMPENMFTNLLLEQAADS